MMIIRCIDKLSLLRKAILTFLLGCSFSLCFGQMLKGRVVDASGLPIPFANVVLMAADSSFVQGTVSGNEGLFVLNPVASEAVILRISSVGYKSYVKKLVLGDIGDVVLPDETTLMEEVVVKGNRPSHRLTAEGLVTNVSGTLLGKLGTAEDVLKYVPGLRKSEEGYEVFGKGTPLIYLNGRKVRDLSELDRLNSEDIKEVTLITNPGAEYDASVHAILKIKTNSKAGDGFGMGYRQMVGFAYRLKHIEQLDWNYRKGELDWFGTAYYSQRQNKQEQENWQEVKGNRSLLLDGGLNLYSKREYFNGMTGFNYDLEGKHFVGVTYTIGLPLRSEGSWEGWTDVSVNGTLAERLKNEYEGKSKKLPSHDLTAYYSGTWGKVQLDWNGEMYLSDSEDKRSYREWEEIQQDYRTVNTGYGNSSKLYATKLVASIPLWGGNLSAGAEFTDVQHYNDYMVEEEESLLPDDSHDKTTEWNLAGFASYGASIDKVKIDAGLRFEHVSFSYYDSGIYMDEQSKIYNNVFPHVSVSFPIKKVDAVLSYTAKVDRPSYTILSSNVQYNDRYTYQGGNPLLQPTTTHTIEMNLSYKWIQLEANWRYYYDSFYQCVEPFEKDPEITVFTWKNLPHYQSLYMGLTLSPKWGWWQPMLNMGLRKQFFHVTENGVQTKYDKPMGFVTFNNVFVLPKNYMLNLDMNYQTKGHSLSTYWKPTGGVNIGLYKGFLHDQLTVNLQANDLFHTNRQSNWLSYGNREIGKWNSWNSREVLLTLRYKFNSAQSKYKGTGAGTDSKRRL